MSYKHFCDICGNEITESLNELLIETENLFDVADIDDCCKECLNIIENSPIDDMIKSKLEEICCPKSEDEEKEEFVHWLHQQPYAFQRNVCNKLMRALNIKPEGE